MGSKTKIDWCDATWNPVTGCLHGCEYCYARRIAQRFGCKISGDLKESRARVELDEPYVGADGVTNPYPYEFLPTFHKYRLKIPQTWKRPKNIFVCSMADLFGDWVPDEWIDQVMTACLAAPQHRYLFLTKNPERYIDLAKADILVFRDNFWYGTTTTSPDAPAFWCRNPLHPEKNARTFISIEPILERFGKSGDRSTVAMTDWVIVGAETGNREGKVIPKKEWIMELAEDCDEHGKPIFMKESLRGIMGDDFRQEFPWGKDGDSDGREGCEDSAADEGGKEVEKTCRRCR